MKAKKILSLIIAVLMIMGTMATVSAEGTYVAKIGTTEYADFNSAMTAANAMSGEVTVEIYGKVEYADNTANLTGSYNKINFVGKAENAEISITRNGQGGYLSASKIVTFTDLILSKPNGYHATNAGHMNCYFSIQGGTQEYTNCKFPNGACANTATAKYTNCTFQNTSEYGLWVYDDALVTVEGGTIDSKKGIKVYSEGDTSVTSTLTVKNATFTANVTSKPAVAIGYAESVTLIGNTYNNTTGVLELDSGSDADCNGITFVAQDAAGNDITSTITAVDRSGSNAVCGVLVTSNGTTSIYMSVTEAAKVAETGDTVTLMYNSTETVELPEGVTLNKNGYTAENVTVPSVGETSTHSKAYTSENTYWGQCQGSADESFEFKFYNNDTYMGYTSLINVDGIIDGDIEVSWHIRLGIGTEEYTSDCGYWKMKWDIEPTLAMQPTRVEHWVDGVKAAECALEPNWADSIFPVVAAVTDNNGTISSYVNNHEGATLANAFVAGGNITMLKDVTLSETLTVSTTTALDLNGKTITYNSTTQNEAMITNKGNLTINDSVGTGVINYNYTGAADSSYGKGNYTISNGGILTVNGGKITIANIRQHAKYPIDNNSTTGDAILVINGGHLYNYNTSAIRQFCNSTTNKNSVTINGGVIEGYCAIWVQNPGKNTVNGKLEIADGEIKTTASAYVNGTADLKDVSSRIYCTIDGDGGAWSDDSAVSITGGTINENVSLAENAPAAITIGEDATFNGYVTVPEEEEDKTLPNAEVSNLGAITVNEDSHYEYDLIGSGGFSTKEGTFDLGIAMEFVAKDTPEEAAANYYGNYTTDFFIKMTGVDGNTFKTTDDYDGSGCYLAGYYPSFGSWVKIPLDGFEIENGKIYPVISLVGLDFKYTDICESVQQFICGIYLTPEVLEKYPELNVNLSLGLSEDLEAAQNAQFTTVGAYTYDKDDFGKQLVNWGTGTDAGFYMDGETKLGMMRFLFHADVEAEDIIDSGIKYIRTDDITATVVSKQNNDATNAFYGDVTGIPDGTADEYAAVAYIVTSKGFIYWSDVAVCSPNFTKHFTDYNPTQ